LVPGGRQSQDCCCGKEVATNALTVINDYSVDFPEEIYAFHKSIGLDYMQFILGLEIDPRDPSRVAPFFEHADQRFKDLAMESHRPQQEAHKVWRNDPHPCGSGLKYKKCCG